MPNKPCQRNKGYYCYTAYKYYSSITAGIMYASDFTTRSCMQQ